MGINLHITRQENWQVIKSEKKILLSEWLDIIEKDPDMQKEEKATLQLTGGISFSVSGDGLAFWTKYSFREKWGNPALFNYRNGNITVRNADHEIFGKMLQLAYFLNAKVQADTGEILEADDIKPNGPSYYRKNQDNLEEPEKPVKPWWRII